MKLKDKMLILIGIPILSVIIILTSISYIYSKSLLVKESRETMLAYTEKYASDIETIISEKKTYVEISAADLSKSNERGEALKKSLTGIASQIKGIVDFYAGFEDKSFQSGMGFIPDADFDTTSRVWYKTVIDSDSTYISDPYISLTGNLVLSISHRLKYNQKAIGVLAADILMDDFKNLINSIKYKDTGKAYLMDKNGTFIIHDKFTLENNISSVENGQLSGLAGKLSSGNQEFLSLKNNGEKRFYAISPIRRLLKKK